MPVAQVVIAVLAVLLAGGIAYCVLTIVAAWKFRSSERVPSTCSGSAAPISILTPLAGFDLGLEENLRSSFTQDYPAFEIVFAVRTIDDPAASVVANLMEEFPNVPARLVVTGEPTCANAKVFALSRMVAAARYDLLVMIDSDVRVPPGMLKSAGYDFQDPAIGLATCPYRAIPGRGWWNALEALGMNTHFLGGVLVARLLEGMKFALGPSIIARRSAIDEFGGMPALGDYLAEDFVMGKLVSESGYRVILSSCRVEHHIGGGGLRANLRHRLRWARSTRRSRPKGYMGEVFTNPLPIALALVAMQPGFWPALMATAALRAASNYAVAGRVLQDPLFTRFWWASPIEDILAWLFWVAGFFGNRIMWRGRRYQLQNDGRFKLVH